MRYQFLIDTYETEILKVLSVWRMFAPENLRRRPDPDTARGRNLLEHMIHQCMGENAWFQNMLGIKVTDQPLPGQETVDAFHAKYAADAQARLSKLREQNEAWWEEGVAFFDARRSRAWVLTRRIAHTAHHRGQQTALVRMFAGTLFSTYGPTADTGGLPKDGAQTQYLRSPDETLNAIGTLPQVPSVKTIASPVTERPD